MEHDTGVVPAVAGEGEFPRRYLPERIDLGEWTAVQPYVQELLERPIGDVRALERWLLDVSELQACLAEERSRRYIAMTRDTADAAAERRYLQIVEEFLPRAKPWLHKLDERYVACRWREQLDPIRYGVLDRAVRADVALFRSENVPLQTRAAVLSQQYQKITGAMTVRFRGRERTLPQMARYLEETDRALRQQAWEAVTARRLRERERLDEIFDELVQLRDRMARNADCADYREYAFRSYHRFDYGPEECLRFHEAVEREVMPLVRALAERRRERLGVGRLRPWDYAVDPSGRPPLRPFRRADELAAGVGRILRRIDQELAEQFAGMVRRGELDLDSRKGKAPGGYQSTLDEVRRPFIFMNAAGVHRDVETLLHESGHAFHALAARHDPLVAYRHAPIEFAEVASMTMELFADDLLEEFYSPADAARAKRRHLEGILTLLPWIAWVDAFQHWLYTNPRHDRRQRSEAWLALAERFEPPTDWCGHEQARAAAWQRQLHLFCYPFYYIEYGIAQLGALQIWDAFRRDPAAAVRRYREALALGGSRPLPELFAAAGARFALDAATVAPLVESLREELAKLPE